MRIISVCFLLIIVFYLLLKPVNLTNLINGGNFEDLRNLSLIITAIISITNIVFLITFFISERNYKIKQSDMEKKGFWYRKLMIEKNIDGIDEAFNYIIINGLIDKSLDEVTFFNKTRKVFRISKKKLLDIYETLEVMDQVFADELAKEIYIFEDEFMKKAVKYFCDDSNEIKIDDLLNIVKTHKLISKKSLYDYEQNMYQVKRLNKVHMFKEWLYKN